MGLLRSYGTPMREVINVLQSFCRLTTMSLALKEIQLLKTCDTFGIVPTLF